MRLVRIKFTVRSERTKFRRQRDSRVGDDSGIIERAARGIIHQRSAGSITGKPHELIRLQFSHEFAKTRSSAHCLLVGRMNAVNATKLCLAIRRVKLATARKTQNRSL